MSAQSAMALDEVGLGLLDHEIDPALVDEVIKVSGRVERRRRSLPARLVVYFVLALCVHSGADSLAPPGYRSVMRTLMQAVRAVHVVTVPSSTALAKARRRLGAEPLRLLFDRTRGVLGAPDTPGVFRFGRRLVAWDGTTVDVPNTEQNLAAFGYHGSVAGNPQVRLLVLIECGTRAVIHAVFDGAKQISEVRLARRLLGALEAGMLLLADRNFAGHDLWEQTVGTGADLLWRVKKDELFLPHKILTDGSYLSVMAPAKERTRYRQQLRYAQRRGDPQPPERPRGHPVRVIEYTVTVTTSKGTRREFYRLVTTLLDHQQAPAAELAQTYHERWESEISYNEFKTRLRGAGFIMRSKTPTMIDQELHGYLIVYQAICRVKLDAADTAGLDSDRISFTITLRIIRSTIGVPTNHQTRATALHDILTHVLPRRRRRSYPRTKKAPKNTYPRTRNDQRRPPAKINYIVEIHRTARSPGQTP